LTVANVVLAGTVSTEGTASDTRYDVLFGPRSKFMNKDATTTTMASPSGAFLDDAALSAG
jgi:hypothetical protein